MLPHESSNGIALIFNKPLLQTLRDAHLGRELPGSSYHVNRLQNSPVVQSDYAVCRLDRASSIVVVQLTNNI